MNRRPFLAGVVAVARFPALAWLLRSPALTGWILAVAAFLSLLHLAGLRFVICPYRAGFGIPCPGCGLTRGCLALLHGEISRALAFHPFSPLFLAAGVLLTAGLVLPARRRERLASSVERLESRTGASMIVLAGTVVFGLTRILFPG